MLVLDRAQIHVTVTAGQICDVGYPDGIETTLIEPSLHQVVGKRGERIDDGGADLERAWTDPDDTEGPHDLRNSRRPPNFDVFRLPDYVASYVGGLLLALQSWVRLSNEQRLRWADVHQLSTSSPPRHELLTYAASAFPAEIEAVLGSSTPRPGVHARVPGKPLPDMP